LEHANSRKLEILEYNHIHSLSKYHPSIPMHLQCCSIIIYLFSLYKLLAASTFYSLSSFDASLNRQLIIIFYICCVWQYFYLTLSTKLLVHLNYVFWFQPKKKWSPFFKTNWWYLFSVSCFMERFIITHNCSFYCLNAFIFDPSWLLLKIMRL
jgi:hypothetical protein